MCDPTKQGVIQDQNHAENASASFYKKRKKRDGYYKTSGSYMYTGRAGTRKGDACQQQSKPQTDHDQTFDWLLTWLIILEVRFLDVRNSLLLL
jgi:hypothetical protein